MNKTPCNCEECTQIGLRASQTQQPFVCGECKKLDKNWYNNCPHAVFNKSAERTTMKVQFDKPIIGSDGVVQTGWEVGVKNKDGGILGDGIGEEFNPNYGTEGTEIDLVKLVLSAYQRAYKKAHGDEGRGVYASHHVAIGYASVELAKALEPRKLVSLDGTDWKYDWVSDKAWINGREFFPVIRK